MTSSWGGRRSLPFVFTEQGVAMLSSVLNSERAIHVNIQIMRIFIQFRESISLNKDLSLIWKKLIQHDISIKQIIDVINGMQNPPASENNSRKIGFKRDVD